MLKLDMPMSHKRDEITFQSTLVRPKFNQLSNKDSKNFMKSMQTSVEDDDDMEVDDQIGGSSSKESTGRWTREEHVLFIKGLEQFGKGWKKIAGLIKTRTVVQIRTHAQKYFLKLTKARQSGEGSCSLSLDGKPLHRKKRKRRLFKNIAVAPPLRPYVKQPADNENAIDVDDSLYNFLSPELPSFSSGNDNQSSDESSVQDVSMNPNRNITMALNQKLSAMDSISNEFRSDSQCTPVVDSLSRNPLKSGTMSLSAIAEEVLKSFNTDFQNDMSMDIDSNSNNYSAHEHCIEETFGEGKGFLQGDSNRDESDTNSYSSDHNTNHMIASDNPDKSMNQQDDNISHEPGRFMTMPLNDEADSDENTRNAHQSSSSNIESKVLRSSSAYSDIPVWYQKGLKVEDLLNAAESVNWLQESDYANTNTDIELKNCKATSPESPAKNNSVKSKVKSVPNKKIEKSSKITTAATTTSTTTTTTNLLSSIRDGKASNDQLRASHYSQSHPPILYHPTDALDPFNSKLYSNPFWPSESLESFDPNRIPALNLALDDHPNVFGRTPSLAELRDDLTEDIWQVPDDIDDSLLRSFNSTSDLHIEPFASDNEFSESLEYDDFYKQEMVPSLEINKSISTEPFQRIESISGKVNGKKQPQAERLVLTIPAQPAAVKKKTKPKSKS